MSVCTTNFVVLEQAVVVASRVVVAVAVVASLIVAAPQVALGVPRVLPSNQVFQLDLLLLLLPLLAQPDILSITLFVLIAFPNHDLSS